MNVKEFDYEALLRELSFVMWTKVKPDSEMGEAIITKLRRLSWANACRVINELKLKGKSELKERLWLLLDEAIEKINEEDTTKRFTNKESEEYVPEWQRVSKTLATILVNTYEEMVAWCKTDPPLVYSNQEVVFYTGTIYGFMASTNPKIPNTNIKWNDFNVKIWNDLKRPQSWCILHDIFMNIYSMALEEEEKTRDFTILEKRVKNFYSIIKKSREDQLKERLSILKTKLQETKNVPPI